MDFQTWLGKTPEGQKAAAVEAEEHVAKRVAIAEKIEGLENGLAEAIGPARKAVKKELAAFERAREALMAAELRLRRAQLDEHNIRTSAESEIEVLERSLRDSALPELREFIQMTTELWDKERHNWVWTAPRDKDGVQMLGRVRMNQIRDVTRRAEALAFEPDPEVAEAGLERLRAEITLEAVAAA